MSRPPLMALQLLARATARAGKAFSEQAGAQRITLREYEVLATVGRGSGLSQTDIMAETGIDRSTTADLVARLVRRGWLRRRRRGGNQRAYSIKLTEDGNAMLQVAEAASRSAEKALLQPLSGDQSSVLRQLLAQLITDDN